MIFVDHMSVTNCKSV